MENTIITFLGALIVLILLFLILREVMCWYWKINERLTCQKETNKLLQKLIEKGTISIKEEDQKENFNARSQTMRLKVFCTSCGQENDEEAEFCMKCSAKM